MNNIRYVCVYMLLIWFTKGEEEEVVEGSKEKLRYVKCLYIIKLKLKLILDEQL